MFTERRLTQRVLELAYYAATEGNPGDWTLQGLGMLRTYLGDDLRLHVWDDRFAVPGVSPMHDHPWHLRSRIIAGAVEQRRYRYTRDDDCKLYLRQTLRCGAGGGLCGGPEPVHLWEGPLERYETGERYEQTAEEIHVSSPERGTVTLVEREFLADAEHAHVFWPKGEEWGSAEPRAATADEVAAVLGYSLMRWFNA